MSDTEQQYINHQEDDGQEQTQPQRKRKLRKLVSEDEENRENISDYPNKLKDSHMEDDSEVQNSYKRPVTGKERSVKLLKKHRIDDFLNNDDESDVQDATASYNMGARSEESYNEDNEDYDLDEEDEYGVMKKRKSGKKGKKSQKPKSQKWENAFDDKGNDPSEPKPERKKRIPKPKTIQNPNVVKTQNKLIGEIVNSDLYAQEDDNDDLLNVDREKLFGAANDMDLRNEELDLGVSNNQKKDMSQLFSKIQNKKQMQNQPIENSIVSMGLVQGLNGKSKISANQLAAKGIKLSIKDDLLKHMQSNQQVKPVTEDQLMNQQTEQQIQPSEDATNQQQMAVDSVQIDTSTVKPLQQQKFAFPLLKKTSTLQSTTSNQLNHTVIDEEESGLMFIDPEEEKKAQKEKDKTLNKKEAPMLKLKNGSMFSMQSAIPQSSSGSGPKNQRQQLIESLKNQNMEKRSANLTLESIKQTFVSTELTSKDDKKAKLEFLKQKTNGSKDKSGANGQDDGLQNTTTDGKMEHPDDQDGSDEDFDPTNPNGDADDDDDSDDDDIEEDEEIDARAWDDDENVVRKPAKRPKIVGEEEGNEKNEESDADEDDHEETYDNVEDLDNKTSTGKRLLKNASNSQTFHQAVSRKMSNASLPSLTSDKERKQQEKELERKRKEREQEKKKMRRYLEIEAELGSDDEENDDIRKKINRDDEDELDGEDLDEDLEGFVVKGDNEEIEDASQDMIMKHRELMDQQDRMDIAKTMQAVLFGNNNKKRKRGEVEGLDDNETLDEEDKRRKKMFEERFRQFQNTNDIQQLEELANMNQINLDDVDKRRQQYTMQKQLVEEEELSEEEIKKQEENNEYYHIKKTLKERDLERFNTLKSKQQKEEDNLEAQIEDMMTDNAPRRQNTLNHSNSTVNDNKNKHKTTGVIAGKSQLMGYSKPAMIDKKSVIIDQLGGNYKLGIDKSKNNQESDNTVSTAGSSHTKTQNPQQNNKVRGSYIPANSMMNFMKSGGSNGGALGSNQPKKTEKAYMFTKAANSGANGHNSGAGRLMSSGEKLQNSPGFLNKKKNFKL
eukprot:403362094